MGPLMPNVEVNRSKEGAAPAPQETCLTQESVPTIGSAHSHEALFFEQLDNGTESSIRGALTISDRRRNDNGGCEVNQQSLASRRKTEIEYRETDPVEDHQAVGSPIVRKVES